MRLSTRGRYAVMALTEMARREAAQTDPLEAKPASIADIAAAQHLSAAYLEQLFGRLRPRIPGQRNADGTCCIRPKPHRRQHMGLAHLPG